MKYVALSGIDPFSKEDGAVNSIYVLPSNVIHFESYSGPFHLQAWSPEGKPILTGKFKQILCGTLVMLGMGGTRIVAETPQEVADLLSGTFE